MADSVLYGILHCLLSYLLPAHWAAMPAAGSRSFVDIKNTYGVAPVSIRV